MTEIVKKYDDWKEGMDEDWVYDSICDFFADLGRGELLDIIEYLKENNKIKS